MKGVVFDIKKFALHDGPGIRTTVFLKGCPLRCWWCHNPESHKTIPEKITTEFCEDKELSNGSFYSCDELLAEIEKDRIFYDESNGGVTFSGGEPLVQKDFLFEMLKQCKSSRLHTCVDTSGYAPAEAFEKIYEFTDLFLFDLKLMNESEHIKYTNVSNKIIHENLRVLTERGEKVIIRIPLIPGITDTEVNLSNAAQFISELKNVNRVDLLPYNILAESKYKRFNKESKLGKLKTQTREELDKSLLHFSRLNFEVTLRG